MKHNPLMIWLVAVVGCSSSTPLGDPDGDVCDPVAELCDGIDNDCDGVIDEGGHGGPMIRDCSTACGTGTEECRAGTWERCDAPQPADETCNGLDDDCDGLIDEDIALAFFQDRDHDGFGTYGVTITACDLPEGYVQNGDDCDDGDPTVHPGAEELMDGIDNDCNGEVDEGVPDGDVCPNLVRQCGDGVLDDGEQCDDYNRLNGDGCDWLCRLGDGEPPPLLDRAVSVYEPVGESFVMNDLIPEWPWPLPRIPLVWTGTELAIAVSQEIPEGIADVRFRRFDTEARAIGIDWVSPSVTYGIWVDLEWTGEEFVLVYNGRSTGIFFIRLDREGRPLTEPVLIISEPTAYSPSIEETDEGYVLVWRQGPFPGAAACTGDSDLQTVFLRLLNPDGSSSGLPDPVMITCDASGPPDVAVGAEGFGIVSYIAGRGCAQRFVWVNRDLTDMVFSGVLSNGEGHDIVYVNGRFYVAWPHWDDSIEGFEGDVCIARFTERGVLEQAPVCNVGGGPSYYPVYLAAGDGGLGIVAGSDHGLYFVRTDLNGTEVTEPILFASSGELSVGQNGITWTGSQFAVVFSSPMTQPLHLQLFGPTR